MGNLRQDFVDRKMNIFMCDDPECPMCSDARDPKERRAKEDREKLRGMAKADKMTWFWFDGHQVCVECDLPLSRKLDDQIDLDVCECVTGIKNAEMKVYKVRDLNPVYIQAYSMVDAVGIYKERYGEYPRSIEELGCLIT